MIQINCGCEVEDYDSTVDIRLKEYNVVFGGEIPSVGHYTVCKACYDKFYLKREDLILCDNEGKGWLNKGEG